MSISPDKKQQLKKEDLKNRHSAISNKATSSFKMTSRIDLKGVKDLPITIDKNLRKTTPEYNSGFYNESCSGLRLANKDRSLGETISDIGLSPKSSKNEEPERKNLPQIRIGKK